MRGEAVRVRMLLKRFGIAEVHRAVRHPSAVAADELRIPYERLHLVQPVVGEHGGSPDAHMPLMIADAGFRIFHEYLP